MNSKQYFIIASIFMFLYLLTSFGVIAGLSEWVHQVCTLIFAGAVFLGIRRKKQEKPS
jgi:hypothetical protein